MAKYIGLLTSDARGKLGGIVMSRARGSTTLKAHTVPKQPTTLLQNAQQATMASALYTWRTMAASDQTTWNAYAATLVWTNTLGTTYTPTGLQLWTQAYINATFLGTVPPTTFPTGVTMPVPIVNAQLAGGFPDMFAIVYPATGTYTGPWLGFFSRTIPASLNYTKTLSKVMMAPAGGGSEYNIGPTWLSLRGQLPPTGSYVACRFLPVHPTAYISGTNLFINLRYT